MAEREAARMTDLLQLLTERHEAVQIVGDAVVAGLLDPGLPVHRRPGSAADGQRDPVIGLPLPPIQQRQIEPAAVFLAQILGKVVHRHQLVGVYERRDGKPDDDVRPGAGIGDHRRLRPEILPADVVNGDRDAGLLREFFRVQVPKDLIGIDEFGRPKNMQGGALLDLELGRRHVRRRHVGRRVLRAGADDRHRRKPERRGTQHQRVTPPDSCHSFSSLRHGRPAGSPPPGALLRPCSNVQPGAPLASRPTPAWHCRWRPRRTCQPRCSWRPPHSMPR